jgi:hypothetical protein
MRYLFVTFFATFEGCLPWRQDKPGKEGSSM